MLKDETVLGLISQSLFNDPSGKLLRLHREGLGAILPYLSLGIDLALEYPEWAVAASNELDMQQTNKKLAEFLITKYPIFGISD